MFEDFESKMKTIKSKYDTYRNMPNKFNATLFNKENC